jgi:hypothetical protein
MKGESETTDLKLAHYSHSLAATRRGFAFYLADPSSRFRRLFCRAGASAAEQFRHSFDVRHSDFVIPDIRDIRVIRGSSPV